MSAKLNAYLQLARISNLPTVFSNVLVGAALVPWYPPFPWADAGVTMVSVALLYIGGMALNDVLDRRIDAEERPQRPIPRGALSTWEAAFFTLLCFGIAMVLVVVFAPTATYPAMALLGAIIGYDLLHKHWAGSVLFMGLCRALVYVVAAEAVTVERKPVYIVGVVLIGSLLALYIVLLTIVARKEAVGALGFRKWLSIAIVLLPLALMLMKRGFHLEWSVPILIILTVWLIRSARFVWQSPPKVVPAVLGWLAGISLLDAYFLTFTPFPWLSLVALACFAVTVWGHRRIAGT